jgi:hypothetical protein
MLVLGRKEIGLLILILVYQVGQSIAGNPDRQGEAGAYELLMNPWARSAGLHTMNTSCIQGVESLRLNVAGLSRINQFEVAASYANYLQGTEIAMNAIGFGARTSPTGVLGMSIMTLDFGDIPITTTNQPEGTGGVFSPRLVNIGLSYTKTFENKVSVGLTLRGISQSISNVSAFGLAVDAGIQYVSGPKDNFKFGISLRNVGSPMRYTGEGLSVARPSPNGAGYELTLDQRSAGFELPSMLNIGLSYDLYFKAVHRLTLLGNFTSNSFSQDQIGGGIEYSIKELFAIRGGYKYEFGSNDIVKQPIYTGISAGFGFDLPLSKDNDDLTIGIDYAYRQSKIWNGTHNFGVRLGF